jgi:hypothetical protein
VPAGRIQPTEVHRTRPPVPHHVRHASCFAVLLLALGSAGCLVASLQPFYDAASIEFDDGLIGEWESAEDQSRIRVDRAEWKSYKVTYTSPSGPVVLTGFLTRIGEGRVLDLTAGRLMEPAALFIPAHVAVRVQVLGDTLTVTGLDYDWILHETEQGRLTKLRPALDHRKNVVLTADTAGLRAWLAAHARDGEGFGGPMRFVRKSR